MMTDREQMKKRYKKLWILAGALFLAVWVFRLVIYTNGYTIAAILSDSFMVPGMVILALALIRLADYYGSFDLVLYTASWSVSAFSKKRDTPEEQRKRSQSFPDYCRERSLSRTSPVPYFVTGSVLSALSVLLALFV